MVTAMTKKDAISKYSILVVNKARELYETNPDKVLFDEDIYTYQHYSPDREIQIGYLERAKNILSNPEVTN